VTNRCSKRSGAWRGALLRAVAVAVASSASEASAYRTFADDPEVVVSARHRGDTVRWELNAAPGDDAFAAVEDAATIAFATWTAPACTALRADYAGRARDPAGAGDARNTVEIVREGWVARGFPPGRAATTDVQLRVAEGVVPAQAEIAEADLYLNFEEFAFGVGGATMSDLDLQGVLTHEIGHVLGLLHPCEELPAGDEPSCSGTPDAQLSVMYPTYVGPSQRELDADDVDAICFLYPAADCPPSCGVARECVAGSCAACALPDCSFPPASCGASGECAVGVCARHVEVAGECVPEGELGGACSASTDCASRLCLTRVGSTPIEGYCTSACAADADCTGMQRCGTDRVCEPVPAGSCSAASGRRSTDLSPTWAALLLAMLVASRIAKARTPGTSGELG